MEHILFLNCGYPLEPLCRALRAGGAVSTVTESPAEWAHLTRIRPWSLSVISVECAEMLPTNIPLPDHVALLVLDEAAINEETAQCFTHVWVGGVSATHVIRAARRRSFVVAELEGELVIGSLILNVREHTAWWSGKEILLTPKQFNLLRLLAGQPGRVFSRAELWEHGWGLADYPESNAIDAHIRRIRRKVPQS